MNSSMLGSLNWSMKVDKATNTIETERLILRSLTFSDADTACNGWTGDWDVAGMSSWLPPHSIDDTIEWLKKF
jgi:RimJ/RimL family protein N-acetyltransferase